MARQLPDINKKPCDPQIAGPVTVVVEQRSSRPCAYRIVAAKGEGKPQGFAVDSPHVPLLNIDRSRKSIHENAAAWRRRGRRGGGSQSGGGQAMMSVAMAPAKEAGRIMPRSFYVIDGHAQIYRAFYAPFRELSSPAGEPTKATFVFAQMLLNLVEQRKPDFLAMAIDCADEEVFRRRIYPPYKANRPPRPPDFNVQEQRILRLAQDAGVPILQAPGFEADDIIATLCRRLAGEELEVVIVSKDKDLRQVLSPHVRMYDPQSDQFVSAADVEREWGFPVDRAVEVQTLCGDPTDNVPGVPGVGEITAVRLIRQYGSVDGVLSHIDELTPKLRENLRRSAELLPVTRQLVTLRDDVPIEADAARYAFRRLDEAGLRRHFAELGFTSLLRKLAAEHAPAAPAQDVRRKQKEFAQTLFDAGVSAEPEGPSTDLATSEGCDYRLVDTAEKLAELAANLKQQRAFAFDTETDALGAMSAELVGMSFSWRAGSGFYVPVRGPAGSTVLPVQRVLEALRPVLEDAAIGKVGHNIKYDMLVMRRAGAELRGIVMDTMVAAFVLDSGRTQYGIDALARDLLGFRKIATAELIGSGRRQISMAQVPVEKVARYAAEDADIAWRLHELLRARLEAVPELARLHAEVETPLIEVLAEMEYNGVAIDPEVLRRQSELLGQRIEELRRRIMEAAGCQFNPDSPRQLADVLFGRLKLPAARRTKTGLSTDVEVLEKLAGQHPVPKLVLDYRSLVKLKNTYLDNLTQFVNERTGRIHASFHQTGAATGRLSCSDPNLQNIPVRTDEGRAIRQAFVPGDPENNVLLTADYSQIELRMLAHFTEEPALLEAFAKDEDIHAAVAAHVFGVPLKAVTREQRAQAKIVNFGIIYGISAQGLVRRIDGMTLDRAERLIATYNERFPGIRKFMEKCVMDARAMGYVQTILGRRRYIPELASPVLAQRNAGERMAINSVVQGSAADLIKLAMLAIHRRIRSEGRPSRMLLQVHDELVFETPASAAEQEAAMIRQEMTAAMKLKVPLKVEVGWGKNWQELK